MTSENKLTQHGVIGLLTAILAVQGWSTVKPDDIHKSVVEHGKKLKRCAKTKQSCALVSGY